MGRNNREKEREEEEYRKIKDEAEMRRAAEIIEDKKRNHHRLLTNLSESTKDTDQKNAIRLSEKPKKHTNLNPFAKKFEEMALFAQKEKEQEKRIRLQMQKYRSKHHPQKRSPSSC